MSDIPKTIPEITAKMRAEGHTGPSDCLEWVHTKMQFYADQLDEAFKRHEKTSLDQICDAVNLAGHERYLREHGYSQKRNCDRYRTVDVAYERFAAFVQKENPAHRKTSPLFTCWDALKWVLSDGDEIAAPNDDEQRRVKLVALIEKCRESSLSRVNDVGAELAEIINYHRHDRG